MKRIKEKINLLNIIFFLIIVFLLFLYFSERPEKRDNNFVILNQDFINGLYKTEMNLSDPVEVFRYVFNSLDKEVTVYPTENYFYFKFPYGGRVIGGSMNLGADNRDEEKVLSFGYGEDREDPSDLKDLFKFDPENRVGGGKQFSEKDGLYIKKISDFKYSVTFEGKKVIFNLYDIGYGKPEKARLDASEIYVGPVFDDAGIKLILLYNKAVPHMYMILNEDDFVADIFEQYSPKYPDLVIGKRTKFVFYNDTENNRKILVGVKGENVLQNNWYDGPHDHMPDNYIKLGKIPDYQEYLEKSYYGVKGRIDKYGNYIYENGTRIAVGPYRVYFSEDDFEFISYCKSYSESKAEFYNCITTQVYDIPDEISAQIYPGFYNYETIPIE